MLSKSIKSDLFLTLYKFKKPLKIMTLYCLHKDWGEG